MTYLQPAKSEASHLLLHSKDTWLHRCLAREALALAVSCSEIQHSGTQDLLELHGQRCFQTVWPSSSSCSWYTSCWSSGHGAACIKAC